MTEARTRQTRSDEVRQQRRRRDDVTIDGGQRLKLAIPPEIEARLKAEGRVPRWGNDDGNRMVNLTKHDDYDKVPGIAPIHVGTTKEGKPIKAHLLSKPAAFIAEDKAKLEARRKQTEQALLRGKNPEDPIAGSDAFYADAANQIHHGGPRSP